MPTDDPLVSIGLPVYNGQDTVENVVKSVLGQDHENIELVISDNASTDGTEEICRELAGTDPRIVYHRHAKNVGLLKNFVCAIDLARGIYFRWIGDDDWIHPSYVSRCLEVFADDARRILVSTQFEYLLPDGAVASETYEETALGSADPAERFDEMLRLFTAGFTLLDPIYSLVRREPIAALPRRDMLREDEVFAARMALVGPWGHIPEVLAHREWSFQPLPSLARMLDVPLWESRLATVIESRELWHTLQEVDLTQGQLWRARGAIGRLSARRVTRAAERAARKIARVGVQTRTEHQAEKS